MLDVGPGDYVVVSMSTTHRWVPRRRRAAAAARGGGRRATSPSHPATCPARASSWSRHRSASATCGRRRRCSPSRPRARTRRSSSAIEAVSPATRTATIPSTWSAGPAACTRSRCRSTTSSRSTGRIHQPPPVHQTFAGPSFVVCSFVPRLFDYHPLAIPAPYNHANVDSDELLFYVGGDFMSRKGSGVGVGSISLHPAGFVHGPQPGSVEASHRPDGHRGARRHDRHLRSRTPRPGRLRV